MNILKDSILNKKSGLLLYGITPPKINTEDDKMILIANKQIERLKDIDIDGLILYDIQDESSRTDSPRPYPFMPTLSPDDYSNIFLKELRIPKIIYKSVGKYTSDEFKNWISKNEESIDCTVFVGTPSKYQDTILSLNEAYKIKQELNSSILMGGVTIPERHRKKGDEHIRLYSKIDKGCNFFISQCVYSLDNTKDFMSDYYYSSIDNNRELFPIIFTLTPCGSLKTLQFMEWLGIDIPKWLHNDLKHSKDILSKSIDICKTITTELLEYNVNKNIPIGFNIESVAIRKEEIEASIELAKDIKALIK